MGRHYYGDIEGKFWFGVQDSDSADRFGVEGQVPNFLEYYFNEDDIETVENELKNIKHNLGDNFDKITKFFEEKPYYTDDEIADLLGVGKKIVLWLLKEYADYSLGLKILNELKENGVCEFNAEL